MSNVSDSPGSYGRRDGNEGTAASRDQDGLNIKLRELESLKAELATRQSRVDEDIQAVKRTMQLVSA